MTQWMVVERDFNLIFDGDSEVSEPDCGEVYGPFSSFKEADKYGKKHYKYDYWVKELHDPVG